MRVNHIQQFVTAGLPWLNCFSVGTVLYCTSLYSFRLGNALLVRRGEIGFAASAASHLSCAPGCLAQKGGPKERTAPNSISVYRCERSVRLPCAMQAGE